VTLSPADLTALLQLLSPPGAGGASWRRRVRELWPQDGTLTALVQRLPVRPTSHRPDPARWPPQDAAARVDEERALMSRLGIQVLTWRDDGFPLQLRETDDPPLALFIIGENSSLVRPAVAIVGSRRASPGGCRTAESLAADLAREGLVIVSGLAEGVDAAAHRGALRAGGCTAAVLGSGLARLYPARHARLARAITDSGGVLVSEYLPSRSPAKYQFPERNRIISGLSLAVVVVEASERSGSLITARSALEQGRDVMAVPGPAGGRQHAGCHRLIKQGAALIETADDVLAALGFPPRPPAARVSVPLSAGDSALLDLLGPEPTPVAELHARSGLPVAQLQQILSTLELAGFVACDHRGYIRCPPGGASP
jgi:DNA processing protein